MPDGRVLVVGAGFSGSVLARRLAESGLRVRIVEARDHIAGNCHTERDSDTGIMIHRYGPHILHTDDADIWAYLSRFAEMVPYTHRVMATAGGQVFTLPVNLHTINQFFGKTFSPDEARDFISGQVVQPSPRDPENFETAARASMGPALYEAFFRGYTQKQWGRPVHDIPASVLARLPLRFTYETGYFNHRFQGIPRDGYSDLVGNILDHPGIELSLGTPYTPDMRTGYDHLFWTGTLDGFFDHRLGRLAYRTLDFEEIRAVGDYQGCAVMNYCDAQVRHTRITEHKHFAPWETHEDTVCFREFSREATENDTPFYPVRLAEDHAILARYQHLARATECVTFLGRLGTYRYLDMDQAVSEALKAADTFLDRARAGGANIG